MAQRGADVLVAHFLAELFEGHALRLQGFHERDAVAKLFADAVLHQFVHHAVRQLVTFGVEIVQNQLALDQLLQGVVEQFVEFLLEHLRLRRILLPQRADGVVRVILHFRVGDDRVVDDGLDAVGQFRTGATPARTTPPPAPE